MINKERTASIRSNAVFGSGGNKAIPSPKQKLIKAIALKMLFTVKSCLLTALCLIVKRLNPIWNEVNERV